MEQDTTILDDLSDEIGFYIYYGMTSSDNIPLHRIWCLQLKENGVGKTLAEAVANFRIYNDI